MPFIMPLFLFLSVCVYVGREVHLNSVFWCLGCQIGRKAQLPKPLILLLSYFRCKSIMWWRFSFSHTLYFSHLQLRLRPCNPHQVSWHRSLWPHSTTWNAHQRLVTSTPSLLAAVSNPPAQDIKTRVFKHCSPKPSRFSVCPSLNPTLSFF